MKDIKVLGFLFKRLSENRWSCDFGNNYIIIQKSSISNEYCFIFSGYYGQYHPSPEEAFFCLIDQALSSNKRLLLERYKEIEQIKNTISVFDNLVNSSDELKSVFNIKDILE